MIVFYLYRDLNSVGWDEYASKVIVAENEARARQLANENAADFEGRIWEDVDLVECEVVNTEKEDVILTSFYAA